MQRFFLFLLFFCLSVQLFAQGLKFHNFFGNGMVLQKDQPIPVRGEAKPGTTVSVVFQKETKNAKADKLGHWEVVFNALPSGSGLSIIAKAGKEEIKIIDIVMGDLWLCGGQSNMEYRINQFKWAEEEYKTADYPLIRHYKVKNTASYSPQWNVENEPNWKKAIKENISSFSAVGYWFARTIQEQNPTLPIGLISCNWGGTSAENWIPFDVLKKVPTFTKLIQDQELRAKKNEQVFPPISSPVLSDWSKEISTTDIGMKEKWYENGTDLSPWIDVELPLATNSIDSNFTGAYWLCTDVELPNFFLGQAMKVNLGRWKGLTKCFINGKEIEVTQRNNDWVNFTLTSDYFKKGMNRFALQVVATEKKSGTYDTPLNYNIHPLSSKEGFLVVAKTWKLKYGTSSQPPVIKKSEHRFDGLNNYQAVKNSPGVLFNAMLNPLTFLPVKGVIWYQGESNATRSDEYKTLIPNVISSWRTAFKNSKLPFYQVQLANYRMPCDTPCISDWAELREVQFIASKLPNCGLATAIDLGEANDIHPQNKKDVGKRLALWALKNEYKKDVNPNSPEFLSYKIEGQKVVIQIKSNSDLRSTNKYGICPGFYLFGEDGKWHWASGQISGPNTIEVFANGVKPVHVRYAWATNPDEIAVYDQEGLPLLPFRTDTFDYSTKGRDFFYEYPLQKHLK